MKTRIEGVEKSLIKKSKKKNKKKTKKVDVIPSDIEDPTEPGNFEMETADLSDEVETIGEISNFIRNQQSVEDDFNSEAEPIDDNGDAMVVNVLESNLSGGETKKLKRQVALEVKVDRLEKNLSSFANDLKEIKSILNIRSKSSKKKGGIAAYCKEACVFPLLPKFRLKLVPQVKKMETDTKNNDYKEQLVS